MEDKYEGVGEEMKHKIQRDAELVEQMMITAYWKGKTEANKEDLDIIRGAK